MRAYYEQDREHLRLRTGWGLLELIRTQELLRRFLPAPPASVLDVGGGAGAHAEWLAIDGYQVHLLDPIESHVDRAAQLPGVRATVGDALALPEPDASQDVVLLLGPLYHLSQAADRLRAWREAVRVLRPGGLIGAATISRFAALQDGIHTGMLGDARWREMTDRELRDGQHLPPRNVAPGSGWFTDAYLHHPTESVDEARAAGLESVQLYAIEGLAARVPSADLDAYLSDAQHREHLLHALRQVECEPTVLGTSSHLLTVAAKP